MSTDAQPDRLLKIVALSLALGRRHLADYGSYKSRKDFTQHQLMACLILRTYLKTTYRGVIEFLAVSSDLREAIGLDKLPNYSTLKKFADKPGVMDAMHGMLATLAEAVASNNPDGYLDAAMDATGLETSGASAHFVSRAGKTRKKFIKVSVLILCSSLVPASVVVSWGPGNDKAQAGALIDQASSAVTPDLLYADAGYDAEWVHERCVDWGVMSVIKPARCRADGSLGGLYRSQMTETNLKKLGYGRRWLAETFMSGMKRTMGSTLNATSERGLMADALMKVLAYAIRR
jgi:hypothetical protein